VRRLLLLGVSVLTAVAIGVSTHAAASAPATALPNVSCSQKTLVFLFWPNGHGAIRSVGFSPYKTPHLEVYKFVPGYPNSAFLAFAASNKLTSFAKACRGKSGKVGGPIAHHKAVTSKKVFSCSVAKGALITTKPIAGGLLVQVGTASSRVISAKITKKGSTLTYDAGHCGVGPSPR
jgi:hypothetical protein